MPLRKISLFVSTYLSCSLELFEICTKSSVSASFPRINASILWVIQFTSLFVELIIFIIVNGGNRSFQFSCLLAFQILVNGVSIVFKLSDGRGRPNTSLKWAILVDECGCVLYEYASTSVYKFHLFWWSATNFLKPLRSVRLLCYF